MAMSVTTKCQLHILLNSKRYLVIAFVFLKGNKSKHIFSFVFVYTLIYTLYEKLIH